jgi:hypothetical protein
MTRYWSWLHARVGAGRGFGSGVGRAIGRRSSKQAPRPPGGSFEPQVAPIGEGQPPGNVQTEP